MTAPLRNRSLPLLLCAALLWIAAAARAQVFPIYDVQTSHADDPTTQTWALFPFYSSEQTSSSLTRSVHPFYSRKSDAKGRVWTDVLHPFYAYRYEPGPRNGWTDFARTWIFPFYFSRSATAGDQRLTNRVLFPFLYTGRQQGDGKYFVLFPFIWYAENARLTVPLFPKRPQTFAALWPIYGDFRGYWNRDRIVFFLWPLFVYSNEGRGDDYNEILSFLWPIFAKYDGPKVGGFRAWPLASYVAKEGEFQRGYFLWPLGHYRRGRISKADARQESVTMFLPFYADYHRPGLDFNMVFPFYGDLKMEGRRTRGWLLGLVNQDYNYRQGTMEERFLWFVFRSKKRIKSPLAVEPDKEGTTGGGLFPLYIRYENEARVLKSVLWPFHVYRANFRDDYDFYRTYFLPFWFQHEKKYKNGEYAAWQFFFPVFRESVSRSGELKRNALHFFWYSADEAMERTWAPLWTFYSRSENARTGEKSVRWFANLYRFERKSDSSFRERVRALFYESEYLYEPGRGARSHWRLFWGLAGSHTRDGKRETELLWMRW